MPVAFVRQRRTASSELPRDRRRLTLAAAAVLAGLPVMLGTLAWRVQDGFAHEHRAYGEVRAAIQHRSALRDVFAALLEAESGQRGYLLTGREAYLAPYLQAGESLPGKLTALVAVSRDAADRAAASRLQALSRSKLEELQETVALARRGRRAEALKVVGADVGRQLMVQVRDLCANARARDDALILASDAAADRAERATAAVALVVAAVVMLTLAATTWVVLLSFRGRRRALHAALASEERYRLVTDHAPDVIIRVDPQGRFTFVSPSSAAVLGYAPDELIGRELFSLLHPDDLPAILEQQRAYLAAGPGAPTLKASSRMIRKDGTVIWVSGRPTLVYDDRGRPLAAYDVLRDVTARRQMEASLEQARRDAEGAAEAKSDFLANMSHELRTPLTAIVGYGALLADAPGLDRDAAKSVQRIRTASQALLAVVNDVLDFSKLEAGSADIRPQPCDVAAVVDEVREIMDQQARVKGLRLTVGLEAPNGPVEIDPDRVRQVLLNLVGNAIKFTREGSVRLSVRHADGALVAWIADTGPGVAPELADRLFQRFSQVDGSSTRRHGGTGLGLAICKGLVEAMGGRIGVRSRPGVGSLFWFAMPAPKAAASVRPAVDASRADRVDVAGLRVLVVDDNMVNRELVAALLRPSGCEVAAADDAEAALEVTRTTAFDLIMIDRHMPGMSGLELAQAIRGEDGGANAQARLLAFSADVMAELESVFDGELHKPITPAKLMAAVAACRDPRSFAEMMVRRAAA